MNEKYIFFSYAGLACKIIGEVRHIDYLERCYKKSPFSNYLKKKKPANDILGAKLQLKINDKINPRFESFLLQSNKVGDVYTLFCTNNLFFIFPILEQVFRKIYHTLFFRFDGLVLHASAVVLKKKAYIFMGPSGSGKSTVGKKICTEDGDFIQLADNNIHIRIVKNQIIAYPPAFLEWNVKYQQVKLMSGYTIGKLYFLEKSKKSEYKPLDIPAAFSLVYSQLQIPSVLTIKEKKKVKHNLLIFMGKLYPNFGILRLNISDRVTSLLAE